MNYTLSFFLRCHYDDDHPHSEDDTPPPPLMKRSNYCPMYFNGYRRNTVTFLCRPRWRRKCLSPLPRTLMTGMTYSGSMTLLNESENLLRISHRIQEEDDEHQFFHQMMQHSSTDQDGNGNPVD